MPEAASCIPPNWMGPSVPRRHTDPDESRRGFTEPASRSGRFGLALVTQRFHKESIKNIERVLDDFHIQSLYQDKMGPSPTPISIVSDEQPFAPHFV
jgi:hypothetical protein